MNRSFARKTLCIVAVLAVLFNLFAVPASAEAGAVVPAYTALKNPTGELIAVSKYGDTENFPEQSLEALLAASEAGADMVYVTVRKTADGCVVLLADENLSRMCVDSLGNVVEKNVSEVGYHELSEYHLRNSTGSLHEKITDSTLPTLTDAAKAISGTALMLPDAP